MPFGLWGTQPLAATALRSQELADQPAAGSIPAALFCSALAHPTIATAAVNNAAVNEWVSFAPTKKGAAETSSQRPAAHAVVRPFYGAQR